MEYGRDMMRSTKRKAAGRQSVFVAKRLCFDRSEGSLYIADTKTSGARYDNTGVRVKSIPVRKRVVEYSPRKPKSPCPTQQIHATSRAACVLISNEAICRIWWGFCQESASRASSVESRGCWDILLT